MTSFKQEPSAEPSLGSQCIDPLDSFINYEQTTVSTPSISPLSSRAKSISTPASSSTTSQQHSNIPIQPSPQTFSGPSHQYGQYKQQAGLPVGALANTFAVNQVDQFGFGRDQLSYGLLPPTDGYFGMSNTDDTFDFGPTPVQTLNGDMDFDFGSPVDMNMSNNSFIDPATIGEQDVTSQPQAPQQHNNRIYPGMHQQAALAKAQAEAARQQRQQQQNAEHQQRTMVPAHSRQNNKSGNGSRPPTDPIVEESISRLLNQMRHSSVTSSNDGSSTPNANGGQSYVRPRKDEEDMDEDERLLASEEGKKLSSKERRQLRNKVSARAFRSRRKEYIGQLEGEIAAKQCENDELRSKNEALTVENTRLTDLTRMLLSSPAFSTFLNDLSATGIPASIPEPSQTHNQTSTSRTEPSNTRKDVNPNHITSHQPSDQQQQNDMHVGLTMIPEESSFDHTMIGSTNSGYNNNLDFGGLYDAQVYAVTSVPQGPCPGSIEFSMLHGKSSNLVGVFQGVEDTKAEPAVHESLLDLHKSVLEDTKDEPAVLESLLDLHKKDKPEAIESFLQDDDVDISDPAFELFRDQPVSGTSSQPVIAPEDCIFGTIDLEKAFERVELVLTEESSDSQTISLATIERFERLCSRLETSSARIGAITGFL